MSLLNNLKAFVQKNLLAVLAIVLIGGIAIGYALFFSNSIAPALSARSKLNAQLADARKVLGDARQFQEESPDSLRTRVAYAQSTLTASLGVFLTESQARQIVNALYGYANASGVTIIELQTTQPKPTLTPTPTQPKPTQPPPPPPAPTRSGTAPPNPTATVAMPPSPTQPVPQPSPTQLNLNPAQREVYYLSTVRLQVQGASRKLLDFVSRIKESSARGVVINNVNIAGGEGVATLTMDFSLYISPSASGEVVATAKPSPDAAAVPVAPPLPPTAVPRTSTAILPTAPPLPPLPPALPPTATLVPPTPTPILLTATPPYVVYRVRPGDTLYAIARRYGTTVEAIMALNRLTHYDIWVGQQLQIPTR